MGEVIQFPKSKPRLSEIAEAIYQDMLGQAASGRL